MKKLIATLLAMMALSTTAFAEWTGPPMPVPTEPREGLEDYDISLYNVAQALEECIGTVHSYLSDNKTYWQDKFETTGGIKYRGIRWEIFYVGESEVVFYYDYDGFILTCTHQFSQPSPEEYTFDKRTDAEKRQQMGEDARRRRAELQKKQEELQNGGK